MNYTKAILLSVSGIVSIAASFLFGTESEFYGFLTGYGYTALAGGLGGLLYTYFKKESLRKQRRVQ